MDNKTEFTNDAAELAQQIGDICDKYQKGAILEAVSMVLADLVNDLEAEYAIPLFLEVLQNALSMAYDMDTSIIPMGKMQ